MSLQTLQKYQLKKLHWLPFKQRIDYKLCLLTYKTLTNQQSTYLYNSLSFPSHSVSTRSSDTFVFFHSIRTSDHHLAKRLSLVHDSGIHSLPIPEIRLTNIPFQAQNKTPIFVFVRGYVDTKSVLNANILLMQLTRYILYGRIWL